MKIIGVIFRLAFLIIFFILLCLNIWFDLPVPTSRIAPPPYSASVQIFSNDGERVGFANAFLVDRELGLVVTNAHVALAGSRLQIKLGGRTYSTTTKNEWVNTITDLAILRLEKYRVEDLPLAADLSGSAYVGLLVQARGYKSNGKGYCADSVVISLDDEWVEEYTKYKHGIETENGWPNWWARNTVRPGCSGSPVLRGDGKVVAIVAGVKTWYLYGYFIPSWEIERLLKRVRSSFQTASLRAVLLFFSKTNIYPQDA